jgi:hypothetical protein
LKVVKEYKLKKDLITPQSLYITKGAKIVSVTEDYDFVLFALCDYTEVNTELRTFQIYFTHANIYNDNIRYIGYCGNNQHIVEIL